MMQSITLVQHFHLIQPLFFVWERYNSAQSSREEVVNKHCHVAKALFTVASVDAVVILTVL